MIYLIMPSTTLYLWSCLPPNFKLDVVSLDNNSSHFLILLTCILIVNFFYNKKKQKYLYVDNFSDYLFMTLF